MKALKYLGLFLLISTLVACNSGSGSSSTPTTLNMSKQPQIVTAIASSTSCLAINSSTTSLGAWWTSGQFNITNTCNTNQVINGLVINFISSASTLNAANFQLNSINGLYFGPPAYWAQANLTFTKATSSAVAATISIAGNVNGYIQPNTAATVSFGYNPSGTIPGAFSYSIQGAAPVTQGNLLTNIDATALSSACTTMAPCNIPVYLTGQNGNFNQTIATITNANAGTKFSVTVNAITTGIYTLSTGTLPQYATVSNAGNITINSNVTTNANITFAYNRPTLGSLSYNIASLTTFTPSSNIVTMYLTGPSGSLSNTSSYGASTSVANLVTGTYTATTKNGIADAIGGNYYDAYSNSKLVISSGTTTLGNIQLTKDVAAPIAITLNISGLNSSDVATIQLSDNYTQTGQTTQQFTYNPINNIKNGITILKLLPGDNIVFNVTVPSIYNTVNPISYTVAANGTISVVITKPAPVTGKIVGYFETWQATATWDPATYSIATVPAYVNIMPLAFAKPDSTYIAGSYNFNAAGLGIASTSSVAVGAIANAQAKGQKVLLSVGGATYQNFAALNVPATIALVKDLNLDGIDLDFEPSSGSCTNLNNELTLNCPTDAQLISIITQLRNGLDNYKPGLMLTAATWSIGAYGTSKYPTTTNGPVGSNSGIWINPLKQVGNKLNAIFLMSYDAGNASTTGYDPATALKAYISLYSGPVYQGIEVPPEAWGGNVSTPSQDVALATTAINNGGAGVMIWALQVQGAGYTASSYLQPICTIFNPGSALCSQTIPLH